jgi:hypothetical protein
MWSTKDLTMVVSLAVVGLVLTLLVVQSASMITGIPGANAVFTVILATLTSFSLLMYEGRRWRFFAQMTIFMLLIVPTYLGGLPFDLLGKIYIVVTAFVVDVVVNSLYPVFSGRKKLKLWSVLNGLFYWLLQPLVSILISTFLYAPAFFSTFVSVFVMLLPVTIVESLAGGYLGYRLYQRVKTTKQG